MRYRTLELYLHSKSFVLYQLELISVSVFDEEFGATCLTIRTRCTLDCKRDLLVERDLAGFDPIVQLYFLIAQVHIVAQIIEPFQHHHLASLVVVHGREMLLVSLRHIAMFPRFDRVHCASSFVENTSSARFRCFKSQNMRYFHDF